MSDPMKINITIAPDGEIQIDVINGQGASCLDEIQDLIRALGDVKDTQKKNSYYRTEVTTQEKVRRR